MQVVKKSLTMFFLGFPLIIISLVAFIGISTTNIGMLWLTAGHALLVPIVVFAFHLIGSIGGAFTQVPTNDVSQLVPSAMVSNPYTTVLPSWWIAHLVFFCSFIITNAVNVYNMDPVLDSTNYQYKVNNRKSRATMIIVVASLVAVSFVALRCYATGAETALGVFVGVSVFGFLGYFWSAAASGGIGLDGTSARNADIFGVVNQMVATSDKDVTVCAPSKTPSATN